MTGDCYRAALDYLLAHPGVILCHGIATGRGPIEGVAFGHAWIEDGERVIDPSNNRIVEAPRAVYYRLGEIRDVHTYDLGAAADAMTEHGHSGPWEPHREEVTYAPR